MSRLSGECKDYCKLRVNYAELITVTRRTQEKRILAGKTRR